MKVFDFDNTLYDGESALDFFLFCLRRKKSLARHLPSVMYNLVRYKAGRIGIEAVYAFCDRMMGVFFENRAYADGLLDEFARKNAHKLKPGMLALVSEEDAVISASPRFLLERFADSIKAKTLICTETEGDHVTFLCYGRNKLKAFNEHFGGRDIDAFYTDSVNDEPMLRAAKRAYFVKGEKVIGAEDFLRRKT